VKTHVLTAQTDYIGCLALAPDGHTLAVGLSSQTLMVWDLQAVGTVETGSPAPTAVPDTLTYVFPQPLQPGSSVAINSIKMFDDQSGWAFAMDGPYMSPSKEHLLHTVDGGQTWREVAFPESGEPGGFFALDSSTAWVAPAFHYLVDEKNAIIPYKTLATWHTRDGGETWQQSQPFSLAMKGNSGGPGDYSLKMQFFDRSNGMMKVNVECSMWRTCQWQTYQTIDGGALWQRVSESEPDSNLGLIHSMLFWDDKTIWGAGGILGYGFTRPTWYVELPTSNDGGVTWESMIIPPPEDLPEDFKSDQIECRTTSVEWISKEAAAVRTECMIYKESSYPRYYFYHLTTDRGKTWRAWHTKGSEDFISATTGWRLESSGAEEPTQILQTTDSGATWAIVNTVPWFGSLNFVSDHVGWAVVSQGEARALLKTMDGGKTWEEIRSVMEN
jgi:photosystem II stability/assembly factor-like uncharacterized protein